MKDDFRHVEFKFPLLLVKTRRGRGLMDRLSKTVWTPVLAKFYLYLMPLIAAAMIYVALFAIYRYLTSPQVGQLVRGLGIQANLLLPGLNPYLPLVYGWIALWVALIVHEGSHGIMARYQGFAVKDSGLIFFLFLPIGAFVELDEEELKRASPSSAGKILAAGAGSNFLVALLSIFLLLVLISTYSPVTQYHGLGVVDVTPGTPAWSAGLSHGDLIISVNSTSFNYTSQLASFMSSTKPGETLIIKFYHQGELLTKQVDLVPNPGNPKIGYIGISTSDDPSLVLKNFLRFSPFSISRYFIFPSLISTQVPFTDDMQVFYTSWLGALSPVLANMFFWLWFINLNLALFNSLPLGPFDGGVAFRHLLRVLTHADWDSKIVRRISNIVTTLMMIMVIALIGLPYFVA